MDFLEFLHGSFWGMIIHLVGRGVTNVLVTCLHLSQLMRKNFVKYKGILSVGWLHFVKVSQSGKMYATEVVKVINSFF